jgi:hypothetical protein
MAAERATARNAVERGGHKGSSVTAKSGSGSRPASRPVHGRWRTRFGPVLLPAILGLLVVNWLWAGSEAPGGATALGGYVSDGHYFLSGHGRFVEVSQAMWQWSLVHTIITLASWPVMAVLILAGSRGGLFARSTAGDSEAALRLAAVKASGPVFLELAALVSVTGATIPGGPMTISFRPDGLIVQPPGVSRRAINRSDVVAIEEHRTDVSPWIEIAHAAPDLGTPLVIVADPDGRLWGAVRRSLAPHVF